MLNDKIMTIHTDVKKKVKEIVLYQWDNTKKNTNYTK